MEPENNSLMPDVLDFVKKDISREVRKPEVTKIDLPTELAADTPKVDIAYRPHLEVDGGGITNTSASQLGGLSRDDLASELDKIVQELDEKVARIKQIRDALKNI